MFTEKLLKTLKQTQKGNRQDKETLKAMTKIQKQKRLSSEEFFKVYDALYKEGPKTSYHRPDNWRELAEGF